LDGKLGEDYAQKCVGLKNFKIILFIKIDSDASKNT
jgi:hypothetical protein